MYQKIKEIFGKFLWLLPLLIGFVLRLYKITASSIWHDEGYTMWLLRYNWEGILDRTARDVHPPGHYLIAKPWVTLFGDSVFSIRFLSLLFSLGIIWFIWKIVKDIWSEKAAFWASLFVAISPFMVRFGQEARMYGVVAFFTTVATYALVKMIKEKSAKYLWLYVPAMVLATYTQYYAFFVVISHWIILSIYTPGFWSFKWKKAFKKTKLGIFSWQWWLANVSILVAYLPWFPIAYSQVTRVSDSYWIRPEWITWSTIPNNILQFSLYSHLDKLYNQNQLLGGLIWTLLVGLALFGAFFILKEKKKRKVALSVLIFGFLPMVLVFVLSKLKTPVYQDRYFPFSAIGVFAAWGISISMIKKNWLRLFTGLGIVTLLLYGNHLMHQDVNHQMKALAETVETRMKPGDKIYSGELYTFLDGSYYFGYGKIKFISKPVDGFGETSLFYDQQTDYLSTLEEVQEDNRVWVIGKTGDKDYFKEEKWIGYKSEVFFDEGSKSNGLKAVLYSR